MKHAELRSIAHNIADSLASGIGLMIGYYRSDVFGDARRSPGGALTVDFLSGRVTEGEASPPLEGAVAEYGKALVGLCARHGGSVDDFQELTARFWCDDTERRFSVTVEDSRGRRSTAEYAGLYGQRAKAIDSVGRLRPKPIVR